LCKNPLAIGLLKSGKRQERKGYENFFVHEGLHYLTETDKMAAP
jgi:hypothetical protein